MGKTEAILATGRRKTAVAQVRILPKGDGKVTVNKKPLEQYFRGMPHQIRDAISPIELVEGAKKFHVEQAACIQCGTCFDVCRFDAVEKS